MAKKAEHSSSFFRRPTSRRARFSAHTIVGAHLSAICRKRRSYTCPLAPSRTTSRRTSGTSSSPILPTTRATFLLVRHLAIKTRKRLMSHSSTMILISVRSDADGTGHIQPTSNHLETEQEFGSLSKLNALYDSFQETEEGRNVALDSLQSWGSQAEVIASERVRKSRYQQRLELEDQGLDPGSSDDEGGTM